MPSMRTSWTAKSGRQPAPSLTAWAMDDEQLTICTRLDEHERVQELRPDGLAGEGLTVALWMSDECRKSECAQASLWHKWVQPHEAGGLYRDAVEG